MSQSLATTADDFALYSSSAPFGTSLRTGASALLGTDTAPLTRSGVGVGNASIADTGVTVIACPSGATAAVDVRGGGPGTRETDLLAPENTVEQVHSIVLSGGSAFGLATADGVMRQLAQRNIGFQVSADFPDIIVPIVPAAVIFDLLLGSAQTPTAQLGEEALNHALAGLDGVPQVANRVAPKAVSGCVGAGVGAMAGAIKGGLGHACVHHEAGSWVAAIMVTNPFGAVIDPSGRLYGNPGLPPVSPAALAQLDERFLGRSKVMRPAAPGNAPKEPTQQGSGVAKRNTTIGCVITNAPLSTSQLKRMAMCAHDGLARAIRPAHAPMDGDTIFALSVADSAGAQTPSAQAEGAQTPSAQAEGAQAEGAQVESAQVESAQVERAVPQAVPPEQMALFAAMAADAVQFAIVDAVTSATSRAGVVAYADLIADSTQE